MYKIIAFCTEGKMPWVIFILMVLKAGIPSDAQSITLLKDSVLPVTGSSFGMSCTLSVPFLSGGISFLKDDISLFSCSGSSHNCQPNTGYILNANESGVFMTISSLDRGIHEGSWTCIWSKDKDRITSNPVTLIVYNAQSLTLVKDANLTVKGSRFGMSCTLSVPFISGGISFLKDGSSLFTCSGSSHNCQPNTGYILNANESGVFMTISSLDRGIHEGSWTCIWSTNTIRITSNPVTLIVYTLPMGISFTQEPGENVDLSMTSATFQCRTIGCSYPDPVVQWMYEDQVIATGIQTSTSDGCTSPEKIYTSTLSFQRNSTLSDNSDKTVIFSCKNDYPDSLIKIRANATKSVRFAVMVKWAQLQQNDHTVTDPTLAVTLGETVTMTCMTGTSRPAPSIVWYIGSEKSNTGTSLTLLPNNTDHDKVIYCQAYNTDPSQSVSSNKPILFVRVKVTEAFLQQNGQTVLDKTLDVTSGKPSTLSCVTGNSRPAANIDWYIGSQKRGNGTSLNFIPTNDDHDKAIYCQTYNIDPSQPVMSNKLILFVRAAPKILDVCSSYKGHVGQCITIQFDFYSNTDGDLTVTAQHSNSSGLIHQGTIRPNLPGDLQVYLSQIPTPDFRATLAISMKSENDFGLYHIEVKNIVGSDSKIIQIIEQITPEKPMNFHITNVQDKQLSLKWLSGHLWGFTQTFVVEISLDNITWNNVSEVNAGNRDGWFSTVIEDLIPGSEYYLRLYAYNIHGRGDYTDVQLVIKTLKESAYTSSMDVDRAVRIGVAGAVGIGVSGIVLGLIGAIIGFTIRRRLNGNKSSCFRSNAKTDDELHSYSNTEIKPHTVKPIYEELNKRNTEQSVYDKISPL